MIIGLFGVPGSGKSYINHELKKLIPDIVITRASELLSQSGGSIAIDKLTRESVGLNQRLLAEKLMRFSDNHKCKKIVIELHNVIETNFDLIELDDGVIDSLFLDAAILINRPAELVLSNRNNDKFKVRPEKSLDEISFLLEMAYRNFSDHFLNRNKPSIIWNGERLDVVVNFINSLNKNPEQA